MRTENDLTWTGKDKLDALPLPAPGSVVDDRYRIIRSIGVGGMGAVFEAEQLAVGRRCALKFLRTELASCARNAARFRREACLLGKLEHEHLTVVFDFGVYLGKSPFLVMEYLEGRTLRQVFEEEGPLPIEPALELMLQAARGMAYVHGQHVVHRDLKPSNLMRVGRSAGRPWLKILDFGIARMSQGMGDRLTPTGAELGTAHYMSPEQARGEKSVDPRSDVYALGAIFYEALTATRVHAGDSYNAVIFHLLTQPHRPLQEVLPGCPDAVNAIVERCLEKRPERRYADGGELVDALCQLTTQPSMASLSAGSGSGVRGRSPALGLPHWKDQTRRLVAGAALGSVVTASVGALVMEPTRSPLWGPEPAPLAVHRPERAPRLSAGAFMLHEGGEICELPRLEATPRTERSSMNDVDLETRVNASRPEAMPPNAKLEPRARPTAPPLTAQGLAKAGTDTRIAGSAVPRLASQGALDAAAPDTFPYTANPYGAD